MRPSRVAPRASVHSRKGGAFGTDLTNIIPHIAEKNGVGENRESLEAPIKRHPASTPEVVSTNTQDCQEYASEINEKMFQDEATYLPEPHYMEEQTDLTPKMRAILLDWLNEVHMKYKLRPETLHLTVNLIDRYLTKVQVVRKRLQLVGVAAMFIASKFEEIHPPELHDWVYITDKAYTKEDVLSMEVSMLNVLKFQIVVPTAVHFYPFLHKANACSATQCELVQYIIELGMLDIRMLQYTPSHMVSAALLLSNKLLGRRLAWPAHMVSHSRHTENSLRPCMEFLKEVLDADQAGAAGQLRAVYKKFSREEHHSVASNVASNNQWRR